MARAQRCCGAYPRDPGRPGCRRPARAQAITMAPRCGGARPVGACRGTALRCAPLALTVWHRAVAAILMRTSPGPGVDTVTVQTSSGFLGSQAIAALHSMGLPAVAMAATDYWGQWGGAREGRGRGWWGDGFDVCRSSSVAASCARPERALVHQAAARPRDQAARAAAHRRVGPGQAGAGCRTCAPQRATHGASLSPPRLPHLQLPAPRIRSRIPVFAARTSSAFGCVGSLLPS
jgi:hypothetical protein